MARASNVLAKRQSEKQSYEELGFNKAHPGFEQFTKDLADITARHYLPGRPGRAPGELDGISIKLIAVDFLEERGQTYWLHPNNRSPKASKASLHWVNDKDSILHALECLLHAKRRNVRNSDKKKKSRGRAKSAWARSDTTIQLETRDGGNLDSHARSVTLGDVVMGQDDTRTDEERGVDGQLMTTVDNILVAEDERAVADSPTITVVQPELDTDGESLPSLDFLLKRGVESPMSEKARGKLPQRNPPNQSETVPGPSRPNPPANTVQSRSESPVFEAFVAGSPPGDALDNEVIIMSLRSSNEEKDRMIADLEGQIEQMGNTPRVRLDAEAGRPDPRLEKDKEATVQLGKDLEELKRQMQQHNKKRVLFDETIAKNKDLAIAVRVLAGELAKASPLT